MNENKNCHCPICKQQFEPKEGTSSTEHLTNGILALYADMQRRASSCDCASNLPCPRCGEYNMSDNVYRNALSRVGGNIHVCDRCGTIQSIEVLKGVELPLTSWHIVSEILTTDKLTRKSETEPPFGECLACGYEFNSELISEYEIKCCPNCGKKIEQ